MVQATEGDLLMWSLLHRRYGSTSAATRVRVVREFRSWLNLNGLHARSGLPMYVGSLLNSGLKIGTVKTYLGYVVVAHPEYASEPGWSAVFSTVRKAHADALVREARRISWKDFHAILDRLNDAHIRLVVIAMAVCGLRLADLQRLRRSQIVFGRDEIRVRVKISKGRRSASKAKTLRLSRFSSIFHFEVPVELRGLTDGPPDERPFAEISVSEVNAALSAATLWPNARQATTYSMRKLYMTTILAYCDWDVHRALEFSMHVSEDSLAAYYDTFL